MVEAEFKLILPKYDNAGRRINPERLEPYFQKVIDEFGGITIIPTALGCWRDKEGKLSCDENLIIYTALDTNDDREISKKYEFLKSLSRKAGKEFGQSAVFVENDIISDVSFIEGVHKEKLGEDKVISSLLERRIL